MFKIIYKAKAQSISTDDVEEIQNRYNISFPDDYTRLMLETNGINPDKLYYFDSINKGEDISFEYLLPIKYGTYILEKANGGGIAEFPKDHLTIRHIMGGNLSMSFQEEEHGSIYVFYSDGEMHKLANSFTEFLVGLEEM